MNGDTISNDNLSLLLIKDYHTIINELYNYHNLDDYRKKICLISCLFILKLYVHYKDSIQILSEDNNNKIIEIIKHYNLHISDILIGFYISNYGPKTCVESKISHVVMRIPTKSDIIFKNIDIINYEVLKDIILNSTRVDYEVKTEILMDKNEELMVLLHEVLNNQKISRKRQLYNRFNKEQ